MPWSCVSRCFALLLFCVASPLATAETCNVRDTGAKGDGRADDTRAIQAAVDRCAQAGGGTVFVPAADYLCGRRHVWVC
jgi:polygalacturonase